MLLLLGCSSQGQRPPLTERRKLTSPSSLQVVKDLARPWGIKWIEVGGVTLTVGLDGTGSSPAPTEDYKMLISEMQVRDVKRPDVVLNSPSTSMTLVRAMIPPGAKKGDRIDVEVRIPAKSRTTSLEGGWLMLTRMKEFARINGRLSSGHVQAMGQGSILVDSVLEGADDPVMLTRGRILGGGVVMRPRELGLRIRDTHLSSRTSAKVGSVINERFFVYGSGARQGVATPRKDSFISLEVHPRYRDNLVRYIRVIEFIPVRESKEGLIQRLQQLQLDLFRPETSSLAAVQLEAIGDDGLPVLLAGLKSDNPEVRFYAAESLGYQNQGVAAPVLADFVRTEPAFRWRGLRALGAMDDLAAQEELMQLLSEKSAETRYGAFRTLVRLAPDDPLVRGEILGEEFGLHVVRAPGSPMVHVSRSERSEIVVFGDSVTLQSPLVAFAGKNLVVRSTDDGRMRVRRLAADDAEDRQVIVNPDLPSVIRAVTELGASYSGVVQFIAEARAKGALDCRLESGAIPQPGRTYHRDNNGHDHDQDGRFVETVALQDALDGDVVQDASASQGGSSGSQDATQRTQEPSLRDDGSPLAPVIGSVPVGSGDRQVIPDGEQTPLFDDDFAPRQEEREPDGVMQPDAAAAGHAAGTEPIRITIGDEANESEDLP